MTRCLEKLIGKTGRTSTLWRAGSLTEANWMATAEETVVTDGSFYLYDTSSASNQFYRIEVFWPLGMSPAVKKETRRTK